MELEGLQANTTYSISIEGRLELLGVQPLCGLRVKGTVAGFTVCILQVCDISLKYVRPRRSFENELSFVFFHQDILDSASNRRRFIRIEMRRRKWLFGREGWQ